MGSINSHITDMCVNYSLSKPTMRRVKDTSAVMIVSMQFSDESNLYRKTKILGLKSAEKTKFWQ